MKSLFICDKSVKESLSEIAFAMSLVTRKFPEGYPPQNGESTGKIKLINDITFGWSNAKLCPSCRDIHCGFVEKVTLVRFQKHLNL